MSSRPSLPTAEEIGTLVPIGRIAKQTPYSADFLRQLARSGKLRAYKFHRDWLTTPDAVRDYLKSQTKRHEKALSLLQFAEKAFLAMALLIIICSVTPKARAQGLSNPPPDPSATSGILHDLSAYLQDFKLGVLGNPADHGSTTITYKAQSRYTAPPSAISAVQRAGIGRGSSFPSKFAMSALLHNLTAGWQQFAGFYGRGLSAVFGVTGSALAQQNQQLHAGLLSVGQALIGKTTEEYSAEAPARLAVAHYSFHGLPATIATSAGGGPVPQVLGVSTFQRAAKPTQPLSATQITALVNQTLQGYLSDGKFTGPQGPQGPPGPSSSGVVSNANDPGRVEDWRRCSVGSAYLLLPVSVGSASLAEP